MELPKSYKNALSSQLSVVEELLNDIMDVIEGNKKFYFLRIEEKIEKNEKLRIKKVIKEMHNIILTLKKDFNLKEEKLSDIAIISSRVSKIWEILCDLKTEKLKRYGKIPDGLSDRLDPLILKMIKLTEKIT